MARRRKIVDQQLASDFDAPDLSRSEDIDEAMEEEETDSTSSELKTDLEDELRNAFSKLKG
jgi:hypothetical protein